jgi:hypothetical protein
LQQLSAISPDENGKWPTTQKLFTNRLRREGRYGDYTARASRSPHGRTDKATGGSGMFPKAAKAAAKDFGLLGTEGERLMAQQFIDSVKNPIVGHIPARSVTFEETEEAATSKPLWQPCRRRRHG